MVGEPLIFNSEVNCFPFAAQLQNRNTEGGFLGMGNTLHAIPWAALTLDTAEKCFRVDIPAQRIKDDPGFDADHWPSMVDQAWGTQLHDYYGRRPYWLSGETGLDPTGLETSAGEHDRPIDV